MTRQLIRPALVVSTHGWRVLIVNRVAGGCQVLGRRGSKSMTHIPKTRLVLALAVILGFAMPAAAADGELALVGGKVYPSPTSQPIDDAVVLVQDGKIVAVGKRVEIPIPRAAQVVKCWDRVIVAG